MPYAAEAESGAALSPTAAVSAEKIVPTAIFLSRKNFSHMSSPIAFHPLALTDRDSIRSLVLDTECRNCDLNFANLMSWRFLYDTETALHNGWLLFRFKADGHNAYLAPVGQGDMAPVIADILADARAQGHSFLMLGVCEHSLATIEAAMPGHFYAHADRTYTDYIYLREKLATLAGKKLQAKRNHANRFARLYPDAEYRPLAPDLFGECRQLVAAWNERHEETKSRLGHSEERRSLSYVLEHWDALGTTGMALTVGGRLVAFTYGAPINRDTFGVCFEKADTNYEGAYAAINRAFAASIPEQYVYLNREEDLGIEGLRSAKLSYHPEILLHKYTVMEKHPFGV